MKTNIIYNTSSENMPQIDDKSVKLVVTSPPYNINIQYGNKTSKGQIVSSKGAKYKDNLDEDTYRSMLSLVFNECKKKITDDGSIWINIKNRVDDGVIIPPFWIMDFFEDMYLKNIIIWNFDWGGSTNKRFAPRYEYVFWFVKDKKNYTFNSSYAVINISSYIYIFIYISAFFISSEILIPNPSAIFLIFCIDTFRFPASTDE